MHQCHIFYIKDKVAKCNLAKIGQGQPRVIILTNYNWQQSPMIHTKFHWVQGRKALKDFIIHEHGGHLGHVTSIILSIFLFPCTLKLSYKIVLK